MTANPSCHLLNQAMTSRKRAVAAVAAVALTDDVARAGFISRRELIESFTTPSYGPTLADETSAAVTAMLLDLGERDVNPADLHVVEQPISARAEVTARRRARRGVVGLGRRGAGHGTRPTGVAHRDARHGAEWQPLVGRPVVLGARADSFARSGSSVR